MNDQFFGGLRQYIFAGSNYVYTYFYHQREMSFFFFHEIPLLPMWSLIIIALCVSFSNENKTPTIRGNEKTFYFFLSLILHENDIDRHYSYAIAVSFG